MSKTVKSQNSFVYILRKHLIIKPQDKGIFDNTSNEYDDLRTLRKQNSWIRQTRFIVQQLRVFLSCLQKDSNTYDQNQTPNFLTDLSKV